MKQLQDFMKSYLLFVSELYYIWLFIKTIIKLYLENRFRGGGRVNPETLPLATALIVRFKILKTQFFFRVDLDKLIARYHRNSRINENVVRMSYTYGTSK